jgi:hypothetical protein
LLKRWEDLMLGSLMHREIIVEAKKAARWIRKPDRSLYALAFIDLMGG